MFSYLKNNFNELPDLFRESERIPGHKYVIYGESPYMLIPDTFEELKKSRKRKTWYNINRSRKLFEEKYGSLIFKIPSSNSEILRYLDKSYELFNERWEKEYSSSDWKSSEKFEKYKDAMISLNDANEGFLAVLTDSNDRLMAYGYCLNNDSTVYFYQHASISSAIYRDYSVGRIFLFELIQELVGKFKILDFMLGRHHYKMEWASSSQIIYKKIENGPFWILRKLFWIIIYNIRRNKFLHRFFRKLVSRFKTK